MTTDSLKYTSLKYTLDDFNSMIFNGFNYELPTDILNMISEIALEVGSPNYVKTPIFKKKDNPMKIELQVNNSNSNNNKKRRCNKNMEVFNDNEWETMRSFQTTKIEVKVGLDSEIDLIRSYLNKITDKNYKETTNNIIIVIEKMIENNITSDEMIKVSSTIFEIASTNRFYSKIYAELYSELIKKYEIMKETFEKSFFTFIDLFNVIEYVDPLVDYNSFCRINKDNEKRKSLAAFFMNLMNNKIIDKQQIILITRNLLNQLYNYISEENKKNEVDELAENVFLLYKKDLYTNNSEYNYEKIDGLTIIEIIEKVSHSKVKDYKSLTNKTIFKFMDIVEM
jgi:hypothetical protein